MDVSSSEEGPVVGETEVPVTFSFVFNVTNGTRIKVRVGGESRSSEELRESKRISFIKSRCHLLTDTVTPVSRQLVH